MILRLHLISFEESRHKEELIRRNQTNKPIGRLTFNDKSIEIIFLHYKTIEEAKEKWNRRVLRVNFDNLIFKFAYTNGCGENELERFEKLNANKKICFTPFPCSKYHWAVYYKGYEKENDVKNDTIYFNRYVDLYRLINEEYPHKKIRFRSNSKSYFFLYICKGH